MSTSEKMKTVVRSSSSRLLLWSALVLASVGISSHVSVAAASSSSSLGQSSFVPTAAFVAPSRAKRSAATTPSNTVLYISSWGTKGPPHRWGSGSSASEAAQAERKRMNPEEKIQAYLDPPEPVEARNTIDGSVLVSGLVNNKERTDQFVFDLLNHEDSAFEYTKIVAFCDDVKFAKKRLLSRSARYTGLLDKLDFVQASAPGSFPAAEQLDQIKSWVAVLEKDDADVGGKTLLLERIPELARLAKQASSLRNVAILVTNAIELDPSYCETAVKALRDVVSSNEKFEFTMIAVGSLRDHPEGKLPYTYFEFDSPNATLPANTIFSREESLRLLTECLQLECGVNRALTFREVYNVNATEAKLVKGLREAGYARPQEIDHMIRKGPEAFRKAIADWKMSNPDAARGYATTEAWWEDPKFQKNLRSRSFEDEQKFQADKKKDARTQEIEGIAKEWAKREFFRERMAGTLAEDVTETDYIEQVWERAMKEGELKYRKMRGEISDKDAEAELADFKARQEHKKKVMLQRAKDELAELLDKEDLGGADLKAKLMASETDDDDDDD